MLSQSGAVPKEILIGMRKPLVTHIFNPTTLDKVDKIMT